MKKEGTAEAALEKLQRLYSAFKFIEQRLTTVRGRDKCLADANYCSTGMRKFHRVGEHFGHQVRGRERARRERGEGRGDGGEGAAERALAETRGNLQGASDMLMGQGS